jgi:redox-sensing transcriptional repressor
MSRGDANRSSGGEARLSRATVGRLSLYLRRLERLAGEGVATISSGQLGAALGVTDAQVRKDLAYLGHLGYPGVGYYPKELIGVIRRVLGLNRTWAVVLVGAGNLARALLRYRGFQQQGFHIAAVVDADPAKVGQPIDALVIQPPDRLAQVITATGAQLGIITVPAEAAQGVADALVAGGIRGILNFAPAVLKVPPGVSLVAVDLAVQLEQLAFLVQNGGADLKLLSAGDSVSIL